MIRHRRRAAAGSIAATALAACALFPSRAQATTSPRPWPQLPWCSAAYKVTAMWSGGFTATVSVTTIMPITSWSVELVYPSQQLITSAWGASASQGTGQEATFVNLAYNGTVIPNGPAVTFGFPATGDGAILPTQVVCS